MNPDIDTVALDDAAAAERKAALAQIPAMWANPPAELLSKLPKGKVDLDYMGHADITLALISIDPFYDYGWLTHPDGTMLIQDRGRRLVLEGWVKVHGHVHRCVGTCEANKFEPEKELIGDLLRNGAMRFGFATQLWSKAEQYDWAQMIEPSTSSGLYEPQRQPEPEPEIDPAVAEAWATFMGLTKQLDAADKQALGEFWAEHSGGAAKPTITTVSLYDVEVLIAEATRLTIGGSFVDPAA